MSPSMAMRLVLFALLTIKIASTDEQTQSPSPSVDEQTQFPSPSVDEQTQSPSPSMTPGINPDVVVAHDGSGNYGTIKDALDASLKRRDGERFVIHVKSGTYNEYLVVSENMKNVMLIGDGIGNTIITGSHSVQGGYNTWNAATIVVSGDGFVARDITFQNTAGREAHQAPALTSNAPRSAFYRCRFDGYQDTLYAERGQQFYRECEIFGTVDFICGNAAVVIQNSNIYAKKSYTGKEIVIAASDRESQEASTGIVIHNCRITAALDLKPVLNSYRIYLGRPWKPYARTIYIKNNFDISVDPNGWLEWEGGPHSASKTVNYREYNNIGLGSSTNGRVKWFGYQAKKNLSEAEQFSVANYIQGNAWLPNTGVPFTSGL